MLYSFPFLVAHFLPLQPGLRQRHTYLPCTRRRGSRIHPLHPEENLLRTRSLQVIMQPLTERLQPLTERLHNRSIQCNPLQNDATLQLNHRMADLRGQRGAVALAAATAYTAAPLSLSASAEAELVWEALVTPKMMPKNLTAEQLKLVARQLVHGPSPPPPNYATPVAPAPPVRAPLPAKRPAPASGRASAPRAPKKKGAFTSPYTGAVPNLEPQHPTPNPLAPNPCP